MIGYLRYGICILVHTGAVLLIREYEKLGCAMEKLVLCTGAAGVN